MHSAPAVSYPVGRSRFQGLLMLALGFGASLAGVKWLYQSDALGWRHWLFVLVLLGACGLAAADWYRSVRGSLRWDGHTWHWNSAATSVPVLLTVHLDGQFVMLLSLRTDGGKRLWLWPERQAEGLRWNALRRAVFSHGAGQVHSARLVADAARMKL